MSQRVVKIVNGRVLDAAKILKAHKQLKTCIQALNTLEKRRTLKRIRKLATAVDDALCNIREVSRIYSAKSIPQIRRILKDLA